MKVNQEKKDSSSSRHVMSITILGTWLLSDPYDKMQTSKDVKGDGSLVGAQFFRTGMEHFRRHHEGAGEIL